MVLRPKGSAQISLTTVAHTAGPAAPFTDTMPAMRGHLVLGP